MINLTYNLKNILLPSDENKYKPQLLSLMAFSSYAILTMFVLVFIYSSTFLPVRLLSQIAQNIVIEETNSRREIENLLPLEVNEKLTLAAQMKAEDMIARDYFSHTGPDNERPWTWLQEVDYNYAAAGENLAIDFFDVKALVRAWVKSPSHLKNIVNSYFTDIGIGVAEGEFEGRETVVVVMFLGKEFTPQIQAIIFEQNFIETPLVEKEIDLDLEKSEEVEDSEQKETQESKNEIISLIASGKVPPNETALINVVTEEILEIERNLAVQENQILISSKMSGAVYFLFNIFPILLRNSLAIFYIALMSVIIFSLYSYHKNWRYMLIRFGFLSLFLSILFI